MAFSDLHLYNLSLQRCAQITEAVFGNFSAPKAQEIVVARGKILELLRPDDETGKVISILLHECFGVIRALKAFRLVGTPTDYLLVGSDSGRINILQYEMKRNAWKKVHEETYGKSGCRRIVPGQYLAVDPKGRACMIAAVEKQKLVYVLNRDSESNLTISSPLEAHKSHTLVLAISGVDMGFENPVFAALEVDYDQALERKEEGLPPAHFLTFYELDLGLNNVTRKWQSEMRDEASNHQFNCNMIVAVPGGSEGPGGVLVLAEDWVIFKNENHTDIMARIPRRYGVPDDRPIMITAHATHVQKNLFFFLIQSEFGDIYKVTLSYEEETVTNVHIKYFDTLAPCVSLCVLKTGFLYCASEFGNNYLLQFQGIGDEDTSAETNAALKGAASFVYFQPRKLTNLAIIDEIECLNPILDMKVADLRSESTPQIYTACGRGGRSTLRVLRHGLAVANMAVSELPGVPQAVWAVKKSNSSEYHDYIVVSFVNATIVLSIGEKVVSVDDSGLLDSTATLSISALADGSLLQVHANGTRHIRPDKRVFEWKTPGKKTVKECAVNTRQVVLALTGGELVYFELEKTGQLLDVNRKEMTSDVVALALGPVPDGRVRSNYLVVGTYDRAVRVLSLEPKSPMQQLTVQALEAIPTSVYLVSMAANPDASRGSTVLYLYVGLDNGVLARSFFDQTTGNLRDARKRFLGTKPVKLCEVQIQRQTAVLALSSRSWLSYYHQGQLHMTPLSYDVLEHASPFSSEQCPEGLVCVSSNTLRIVALERLGEVFNQTSFALRYTPRKLLVVPEYQSLVTIETDQNAYPYKVMKEMQKELKAITMEEEEEEEEEGQESSRKKAKKEEEEEDDDLQEELVGRPEAGEGKWASCVRLFSPKEGDTMALEELEDNEAAFGLCRVKFGDKDCIAVSTVKDLINVPQSFSAAYVRLYQLVDQGRKLELLHKTEMDGLVLAMAPFNGRLLVGVGNRLRIYDLGKKKLLRKTENKNFPTQIQSIHVQGDRLYVGDLAEAFHYVQYHRKHKTLAVFAENHSPRFLTASTPIDYDTMCGGDKFGNVFLSRLPPDISAKIAKDPTGGVVIGAYGEISRTEPHKLDDIMNYHVGECITSVQKCSLVPGFNEVILYSTLSGSIGIFLPFVSRENVEFMSHLEMHMRQAAPPLCGREHLSFRSYYFPVKDTTDGDLCEQFSSLPAEKQKEIATELVSSPPEISKKLEELRNRVL
eukprot:gb/GEZN01000508.1/.p1 GENE.gb/GEZN01000508.1/~~gb/GEZN01000508.1/.p1  ORF type:complete len:1232 (-),score=235.53 gb/GEZN01000508.1/:570-4232(-)